MSDDRTHGAKRVGRFSLVGVFNTLLDYVLFIGFTKALGLPLGRVWIAKLLSGAIAMAGSFLLNKYWVFNHQSDASRRQEILRFLGVTAVGIFVIQLALVQIFATVIPQAGEAVYRVAFDIHLVAVAPGVLTQAFIIKTSAFILATLGSMTWNYVFYKRVVFV